MEIFSKQATKLTGCEEGLKDIISHMDDISSQSKDIHSHKLQEFAYKRKGVIKKLWYAKLNFLKQSHNSMLMNKNKSEIFEAWVKSETFLPKRFRCHTEDMNEEQKVAAK